MTDPKDPKVYMVEALRTFTKPDYQPDVMTERTIEAWQPVDTITTSESMYLVFESWWFERCEDKIPGRYRIVDPSMGYFYEFTTSPHWKVEEAPKPRPRLEAVSNGAAA